jgi:hypothetical protein
MVSISKGEPFLADEYFYFAHDNWLIFVGYPLGDTFSGERCRFYPTLHTCIRPGIGTQSRRCWRGCRLL